MWYFRNKKTQVARQTDIIYEECNVYEQSQSQKERSMQIGYSVEVKLQIQRKCEQWDNDYDYWLRSQASSPNHINYEPIKQEAQKSWSNQLAPTTPIHHPPKSRKTRTPITKQRLTQLNYYFKQYNRQRRQGIISVNLKVIGLKIGLGYSTILHKYRQFQLNSQVKGGILLNQIKRKYKKSIIIQRLITQSLKQKTFYSAQQIALHVYKTHGRQLSRSIISRHLCIMGYGYPNIKIPDDDTNDKQQDQLDNEKLVQLYVRLMRSPRIKEGQIVYFNQYYIKLKDLIFNVEGHQTNQLTINISLACTSQRIIFWYMDLISNEPFHTIVSRLIRHLRSQVAQLKTDIIYLVVDFIKDYRADGQDREVDIFLDKNGVDMFYTPPRMKKLNPINQVVQRVVEHLRYKDVESPEELIKELENIISTLQPSVIRQAYLSVQQTYQSILTPHE